MTKVVRFLHGLNGFLNMLEADAQRHYIAEPPKQRHDESDDDFEDRFVEWQRAVSEWRGRLVAVEDETGAGS